MARSFSFIGKKADRLSASSVKGQASGKAAAVVRKDSVIYRDFSGPSRASSRASGFFHANTVSGKELMVFTRQLASTLSAGLLLTESLDAIAGDMENRYFHNIILSIRCDVEGGVGFTQALAKHPRIFSKTFIAIIRSGEATGALHKTMDNLAKYLENSEKLKEKVITATRYPLFVLGFAIIIVLVMALVLIPKFSAMFIHAGAHLPLLTKIVVDISNAVIHYFWALPILAAAMVAAWLQARKIVEVRAFFDNVLLHLPVLGKDVFFKVYMSRFCRTLGFLLEGGVDVSTSLEITSQVVSSIPIARAVEMIRRRVEGGSEISAEIRKQRIFPALVGKMTSVGERTGRLPDLLGRAADYYDGEVDHSLSRLTSVLEPFLITFIGAIVLIVVLALYLPIFNMSKAVRG